jgi:hypothetical protein
VILERALVTESDGIDEHMGDDWTAGLTEGVRTYSAVLIYNELHKSSSLVWSGFENKVDIIAEKRLSSR